MTYAYLVWRMLWRNPTRTWLTFLSMAAAFLLYGLLTAVVAAFEAGVNIAGADRLVVMNRQSVLKLLPYSHRNKLETLEGVKVVTPVTLFFGWYQDPKNTVPSVAVDPETHFKADRRVVIAPDQLRAFQMTRTGAVAGKQLAEKWGWKIGDRITLSSPWTKKDGSQNWEFELVAIYQHDEKLVGEMAAMNVAINYAYFDEARQWAGRVSWFDLQIDSPDIASRVMRTADAMFENSDAITKTQTEREFQAGLLSQFGDVGLIVSVILVAVFSVLIVVAINTMVHVFEERIPELAVMKTLGFRDATLALLVVFESTLLALLSATFGLTGAVALLPLLREKTAHMLPGLNITTEDAMLGVAISLIVGVLGAAIPAIRSARLTIVSALALGK